MSFSETSNARKIRRVAIACIVCRQRKLKCRRSDIIEGICERCVKNDIVDQCRFVPVASESLMNANDDVAPQDQGYGSHSFASTSNVPHYAPQSSIPAQPNGSYYWSQQSVGLTETQNNAYVQPEMPAMYPTQAVYPPNLPPPGAIPQYAGAYTPVWSASQPYYPGAQGSQGHDGPAFDSDSPAASYAGHYAAPNYSGQQGDTSTNNATNWTGNVAGVLPYDPNGNYYPTQYHQSDGGSEPKE